MLPTGRWTEYLDIRGDGARKSRRLRGYLLADPKRFLVSPIGLQSRMCSPIEAGFLAQLRSHESIRKTIVIDLKQLGDPIYAGMPWRELLESAPMLNMQMLAGKCEGHFYYAHVVRDSPKRWAELAERIAAQGLR